MRFVAVGDSFTEGVGDEAPPGCGGWADRVAQGLADSRRESIEYANLAIRGRLLGPVLAEQLAPALALGPALVSICAGGNDLLRPRLQLSVLADQLAEAVRRCLERGASVLLLSPPDPSARIPLGRLVYGRGDRLACTIGEVASREGAAFVDVSHDRELRRAVYWSSDRLHLNPRGHARVASLVLRALGFAVPTLAMPMAPEPPRRAATEFAYLREHVLPWIGRRLTGRSSGDGRVARIPEWTKIAPV